MSDHGAAGSAARTGPDGVVDWCLLFPPPRQSGIGGIDRTHFYQTARLWGIVLVANLVGCVALVWVLPGMESAGNVLGGTGIFAALTYAQVRQEI